MPCILQTNHLTKTIDGKRIVDRVNLHIKKGEIYGFLGPNGAGKTTVMKMITNLWKPSEGSIEVFGETLTPKSYEFLKRMGSIIEFPTFYEHMTGYENLKLHCEYMGYYNHGSIESSLDMLDLTEAADRPVKNYSLGMKEIEQMNLAYVELSVVNTKKAAYVLSEKIGLENFKIIEEGNIRIYDNQFSTKELSKALALNDVEVIALGKKAETLEDYFLKMTAEVRQSC